MWLRYTDDIFFVWTGSENKLEDFLNRVNNFHPKLKFTYEKSKSFANFLDGSVSMVDNKLEADIYCKPCACHQFLQFNSAHPFYKKTYCLSKEKHLENLKTRHYKRGHPRKAVAPVLNRVSEKKLDESFERHNRKDTGGLPAVTCNSCFHNITTITRKNFASLYAEEKVKKTFKPAVSFLSGSS